MSDKNAYANIESNIDNWYCNVKTSYRTSTENEKWVMPFLNSIRGNVMEFLNDLYELDDTKLAVEFRTPWINIYNKFDYQEQHSHFCTRDNFSYCYYHKKPENSGDIVFVSGSVDYNEFYPYPIVDHKYKPEVSEGEILIFPSWLNHLVTPNKTEKSRVTISGNILVRDLDES